MEKEIKWTIIFCIIAIIIVFVASSFIVHNLVDDYADEKRDAREKFVKEHPEIETKLHKNSSYSSEIDSISYSDDNITSHVTFDGSGGAHVEGEVNGHKVSGDIDSEGNVKNAHVSLW